MLDKLRSASSAYFRKHFLYQLIPLLDKVAESRTDGDSNEAGFGRHGSIS